MRSPSSDGSCRRRQSRLRCCWVPSRCSQESAAGQEVSETPSPGSGAPGRRLTICARQVFERARLCTEDVRAGGGQGLLPGSDAAASHDHRGSDGIVLYLHRVREPVRTIMLALIRDGLRTKEALTSRRLLNDKSMGSVAALGFLGGASSGVLLSLGTSAFEVSEPQLYRTGNSEADPPTASVYEDRDAAGLHNLVRVACAGRGFSFGEADAARVAVRSLGSPLNQKGPSARSGRCVEWLCGTAALRQELRRPAASQLYGRGGFLGLYTGFPLHALRDTFVSGVQFTSGRVADRLASKGTGLYFCFVDTARHLLEKSNTLDSPPVVPQFITTFACGSLGGVLSWFVICAPRCPALPLLS